MQKQTNLNEMIDWSLLGYGIRTKAPPKVSQVVEEGDGATKTGTYRSWRTKEFTERFDPKVGTLFELLQVNCETYSKKPFHGTRVGNEFKYQTYEEVYKEVLSFGNGLEALELLQPDVTGKMTLLGIMGRNHSHWMIAEYACFSRSATVVPLYDSLSVETLQHLLENCGLATIVCDAPSALKLIEATKTGEGMKILLKTLILYGLGEKEEISSLKLKGKEANLTILEFKEIIEMGNQKPSEIKPPKPETVFSFVFTSGSTGKFPKAALIRHSSMISNIAAIIADYDGTPGIEFIRGEEAHLSYLPAAHAYERACSVLMLAIGGKIGYSQGIREKVLDDLQLLRPTTFPSVPRLLNKIHDKVLSGAKSAGGLKTMIFNTAYQTKKENLASGYVKHPIYDPLVFDPIKIKLGLDRCRRIVSGSAPISPQVLDFYRIVIGCCVKEGYGASEVTVGATNVYGSPTDSGHVGGPIACCEIRLCAIPSMPNYKISDTKHNELDICGRGEICIRGPIVMQEYYRNPQATKEAIDSEGFYHSGDVGAILSNGAIKIIDRVKNIFKLSNGEYVSPENIEITILAAPLLSQAYVHGDSAHSRLVGVVVPDPDTCLVLAEQKKWPKNMKDLCEIPEFQEMVKKDMETIAKREGLRSYEVPFKIYIEPEAFTPENSLLTVTMKLQRGNLFAKYQDKLKEMLSTVDN